jgi:alkanesulfonate monooxygenase SsuD/methylene tetrahydromethanopterin reductase-like flavin-dependent oxidoreductase (luciferase family)
MLGAQMEYGAHLPLIELDGRSASLSRLRQYAAAASRLGYGYLCANDHLLFSRPWLDGPTALAAVLDRAEGMTVATTVCLPAVRGPVQAAKTLAALDVLADGRLVVGVGPGSSARDHTAVGLPFDGRWQRFEEATQALRALLQPGSPPFEGELYTTTDITLEPAPVQRPGPPIWIGSWGSKPGLRRVARLGDGWLASGYNTTPETFRLGLSYLAAELSKVGKPPQAFPNGLVTMWLHVTERRAVVDRLLGEVLSPMLGRPVDALRDLLLPIGPAEVCAERLSAFAEVGVQRVLVWPLGDEVSQLELFRERVIPLVEAATMDASRA